MFERRLKFLLALWLLPVLAVTLRLAQLQILLADDYREQARRMLDERPRYFPFLRGDITDRHGRKLAEDAPAWDIRVRYDAIARDVPDEETADASPTGHIDPCWQAISAFSGTPLDELLRRAGRIKRQVERIKEIVSSRRGVETVVTEELTAHPVVTGLDHQRQVDASLALGGFANVEIQASHTRAYHGGPCMGHLLGQVGEVGPDDIRDDPLADDELARYRPGDIQGISGAEFLGETVLRGRRGRIHEDRTGQIIDSVEPADGQAFRLTIDHALQEALYNRLAAAVENTTFRTGGCAVLLHVPTRQILAMVDYPSVDPAASPKDRAELLKDIGRQPLLFRAIREYYPPGSAVKPVFLAGAMAEGLVSLHTQHNCYGRLFVDHPDRYRCTGTHGQIGPIDALQHSCNVYFYHVGERLGVDRARQWMDRFGLGRPTGVGLPGELPGRLPPPGDRSKGTARFLGIGQGALDVTPLQAANMVATVAAGEYRPVTLKLDDPDPRPAVQLPVDRELWRIVREGMYRAVNQQGGTAFGDARGTLADSQYVLLGKTGSAEVPSGRIIERLFTCHLPDGRVQEIAAPDANTARAKADCPPRDRNRVKVVPAERAIRRYPPDPPEPYTHAWFVGYLAPRGRHLASLSDDEGSVAIAVVIEYAGHGGDVAAPVARDMLRSFLMRSRGQADTMSSGGAP